LIESEGAGKPQVDQGGHTSKYESRPDSSGRAERETLFLKGTIGIDFLASGKRRRIKKRINLIAKTSLTGFKRCHRYIQQQKDHPGKQGEEGEAVQLKKGSRSARSLGTA